MQTKKEPYIANPRFILTEPPTPADLERYTSTVLVEHQELEDVTLSSFFLTDPFKKMKRRAYYQGIVDGSVLTTILLSLFVAAVLAGTVYLNVRYDLIPKWEQVVFKKSIPTFENRR